MRLFLASSTQWLRAGMSGVPTGLNYPAVQCAAAALRIDWPNVFEDLRVMELSALEVMMNRLSNR